MRRIFVLLLTFAVIGTMPACRFLPWGRKDEAKDDAIPGPESRRMIAQARDLLYSGRPEDLKEAAKISRRVVDKTIEPRYIWEGTLVIAMAHQREGNTQQAQRLAIEAIGLIFSHAKTFDEQAVTALKMSMPVYVQNAVQNLPLSDVLAQLNEWERTFEERIKNMRGARRETFIGIEEEFDLMEQMARQIKASTDQHQTIRQIVLDYIASYNKRDVSQILKLIEPKSELSNKIIKGGLSAVGSVETITVGSPIEIEMDSENQNPLVATAVVDIIVISRGGWTEVSHRMRFSFSRYGKNSWFLSGIQNHP